MGRRNAIPRNEGEAQDRDRARAALAQMRRKPKLSLRAAAKAEGTTTKSMLRYVGSAIQLEHGRYEATPYDRIPRPMNFYSDSGNVPVTIRDSRTASAIGGYAAAYRKYRAGDSSALAAFRGKSFVASGSAGINRHVAGNERVLRERSQRLHLGPQSCRRHREMSLEA